MNGRSRRTARGATLVELVAAIVIIAVALLGLTLVSSAVVGRSAEPMVRLQALAIAESHLEEVMLANFCDPEFLTGGQRCRDQCVASACSSGCAGGALREASRALYDDVCDYDGLATSGVADRTGAAIAGLEAYDVSIAVDDSVSLGSPAIAGSQGQVVRIDVRVGHPELEQDITVSTWRSNAE